MSSSPSAPVPLLRSPASVDTLARCLLRLCDSSVTLGDASRVDFRPPEGTPVRLRSPKETPFSSVVPETLHVSLVYFFVGRSENLLCCYIILQRLGSAYPLKVLVYVFYTTIYLIIRTFIETFFRYPSSTVHTENMIFEKRFFFCFENLTRSGRFPSGLLFETFTYECLYFAIDNNITVFVSAAHFPKSGGRAARKGAGGEAEKRAAAGRAAGPAGAEDLHQVPEGQGAQHGGRDAAASTGGRQDRGRWRPGRFRRPSQSAVARFAAAERGPTAAGAGFVVVGGQTGGGAQKSVEMGQSVGRRRRRRREHRVDGHVGGESAERAREDPRFARSNRGERPQGVPEAAEGSGRRARTLHRRRWPATGNDRRDGRTVGGPGPRRRRRRRSGTRSGTAAHPAAAAAGTGTGAVPSAAAVPVRAAAAAAAGPGRAVQDRGPEGGPADGRAVHQPAADRHRGHDATDRPPAGRAVRAAAADAGAAAAGRAPGARMPDQEHGRPELLLAGDAQVAARGPAAAQQVAHAVRRVVRAAADAAVQPQGHVAAPAAPLGIAQKALPAPARRLPVTTKPKRKILF